MKYALAQLAFGLGASALVSRQASTCVQLRASGGASGVLGQLTDGQNRIGGGYAAACYCFSNGGFTDANGRGCILTPPTTQFQCDTGAKPTTGFAISSSGAVTYNGNTQFWACPVNNNGEYNVYSTPVAGQTKCVAITLSSAGSCSAASSSRASTTVASSTSSRASSASSSSSRASSSSSSSSSRASSSSSSSSRPATTTVVTTTIRPSTSSSSSSTRPSSSSSSFSSRPATTTTVVTSTVRPSTSSSSVRPSSSSAVSSSSSRASTSAASSSSVRPSTTVATSTATGVNPTPTGAKCPADLNGNYQFPHLIIPVNSQMPNRAYGTSYFGAVNSTTCSIFNFDIPQSYSGHTCTLVFLFPTQAQLQTSSYTISGSGQIDFTQRSSAATQQTTYANQASRQTDFGNFTVAPGNSYTIATGSCAAGQTVSYEMCGSGSLSLNYFQDYNPSPIGLYIREC